LWADASKTRHHMDWRFCMSERKLMLPICNRYSCYVLSHNPNIVSFCLDPEGIWQGTFQNRSCLIKKQGRGPYNHRSFKAKKFDFRLFFVFSRIHQMKSSLDNVSHNVTFMPLGEAANEGQLKKPGWQCAFVFLSALLAIRSAPSVSQAFLGGLSEPFQVDFLKMILAHITAKNKESIETIEKLVIGVDTHCTDEDFVKSWWTYQLLVIR